MISAVDSRLNNFFMSFATFERCVFSTRIPPGNSVVCNSAGGTSFFAIFVFFLAMYGIVKDTKIIFVLTERKNASVNFMRQIRLNIDLCYYAPGRLIFLPPYSH